MDRLRQPNYAQYNTAGNRTAITATTPLSGTVATTDTYDAADQLGTSAVTGGPQPGTTSYGYDGNGNQTGSSGPAGTVANTFNDLNQLTHISGPGTNLTLLYDGQGDRLRSYERGTPTWTLRNEAQDLAGGLSALVSDGTADYAYLSPGDGSAPLSSYTPATSRATYLATDLLGSVRLATDPSGATIGAGAYDAWGVARPYTGTSGATQLAGLQGVAPFGYAGQQRDAGPGTYAMRARRYDPATGRFQSEDPLAYSPQVPVTINPYAYAGNMPTGVTDPSGQGWVFPRDYHSPRGDYAEESAIAGYAPGLAGDPRANQPAGGQLQAVLRSGLVGFWVPVFRTPVPCGTRVQLDPRQLATRTDNANVLDLTRHTFWDIEHANAGGNIQAHLRTILHEAQVYGFWAEDANCNRFTLGSCGGRVLKDPSLALGTDYPAGMLPAGALFALKSGRLATLNALLPGAGAAMSAVTLQVAPGLLEFALVPTQGPCTGLRDCVISLAQVLVFNDFKTLFYSNAPWYGRALAVVGLAGNFFIVLKAAKAGTVTVAVGRTGTAIDTARVAGEGADVETALARAFSPLGCTPCFPAGTLVATGQGKVAIERLRVGDRVLAEDPKTGRVEAERLTAVRVQPAQPLVRVALSDGSGIRATANHVFWVDRGPRLRGSGWLQAGRLRPGDVLRTASGGHVRVAAVHWNQGDAPVYTLTVATDHTFFVGSARVLVHNAGPCPVISLGVKELVTDFSVKFNGSPFRDWWSNSTRAWPQEFRTAITSAEEVQFLLSLPNGTEIDVAKAIAAVKADPIAIKNPFSSSVGVTNWELYELSLPENSAVLARTKFFIKMGFEEYIQVPRPAALETIVP